MFKIIKLILVSVLVLILGGVVSGEEKSKLRWEYKYQEGECLKYWMEGRDWLKGGPGVGKGYDRKVEAVLGINVYGEIEKGKRKTITWTKVKKVGEQDMQWHSSNTYGEGITGEIQFAIDGGTKGLSYTDLFFLGQPQFVESGLDLWSKDIHVNEAIGQAAGSHMTFTAHYRKLGEERVDGENLVIFETEIGRVPGGTPEERGKIYSIADGEFRMELYSKSWFSPEKGRVIKMDSELILYQNGKEYLGDKFHFKLLTKEDIKKLDGIEDNWELVLPDTRNFQLLPDGRIIVVKEEMVKEKVKDSVSVEGFVEKEVKKNFIYICDGDGKNQEKIAEGVNPAPSPDGKWMTFIRKWSDKELEDLGEMDELWLTGIDGKNPRKIEPKYKFVALGGISWSYDSKRFTFGIGEKGSGGKEKQFGYYPPIKYKYKLGLFEIEESKFEEIENIQGKITWLPDNYSFVYGSGKYYLYDLKEQKSKELEEFSKQGLIGPVEISPKELVIFSEKENEKPGEQFSIFYFNSDFKIEKEEPFNKASASWPRWSRDGKFLILSHENGFALYSLAEHKILWETRFKSYFPKMTIDGKWFYLTWGGAVGGRVNLYRIPGPKELQELLRGGN